MDLLLFLMGGGLLAAAVRWWRPEVSRRAAAGHVLAAGLFFSVALATPALQVPADIAYIWFPWAETVEETVVPRNPVLRTSPRR